MGLRLVVPLCLFPAFETVFQAPPLFDIDKLGLPFSLSFFLFLAFGSSFLFLFFSVFRQQFTITVLPRRFPLFCIFGRHFYLFAYYRLSSVLFFICSFFLFIFFFSCAYSGGWIFFGSGLCSAFWADFVLHCPLVFLALLTCVVTPLGGFLPVFPSINGDFTVLLLPCRFRAYRGNTPFFPPCPSCGDGSSMFAKHGLVS